MQYTLRYEKDPTWSAFHYDQDCIAQHQAIFEPKYIWYLGSLPYAISPAFSQLSEAQQWFEFKCCKGRPDIERREIRAERRLEFEGRTLDFSKKYDRRGTGGRRWTDQVARYI